MTKPPPAANPSLTVTAVVILLLLCFRVAPQEAASFILKPPEPQEISTTSSQVEGSVVEPAPERFLILTTGEQIKLYKFSDPDTHTLAHDFYLVRPAELDEEQSRRLPNSSFSRWLLRRALHRSLHGRRKSVIPESQYEHEEADYGDLSGWLKPRITHVDYFFDSHFCDQLAAWQHCLVVVWLDKANNYVRYKNILWLHEFPPVDILRDVVQLAGAYRPHAHAMVVDQRKHRLHVALSDGSSRLANYILSGILRPDGAKNSYSQQLDEQSLVGLVRDHREENSQPDDHGHEPGDLAHLNVDEANGNWLFYCENRHVYAVNVKPPASIQRAKHPQREQANVVSVSPKPFTNEITQVADKKHPPVPDGGPPAPFNATTGFAMDKVNRRLFWIDQMNTLFSSHYSGLHLERMAKLSMKPVIKSADTIQVLHDAIYISDPIKKSLLVHPLPAHGSASGAQSTNSISTSQATGGGKSAKANVSLAQQQQVIVVEMPTLYGFRVFELEEDSRTSRLAPPMAAGERRVMAVEMANLITSTPRSHNILGLTGEPHYTATYTGMNGDAPGARAELEINLTSPPIEKPEEVLEQIDAHSSGKLASLVRLNTYVELLLVSILMITCFVILNLLIRTYRQRHHQQELKANLMKNCSI